MADRSTEGSSAIKPDGRYTVENYRAWNDNERWELIHGVPFNMSPAPKPIHQRVVGHLFAWLERHLNDDPCEPFVAPIDVYLPIQNEAGKDDTVVQPDVVVVCDPSAVTDHGIVGVPEFVAEVLSDSTAFRDFNDKKALYESVGVKEFWIINPGDGSVLAWRLEGGRFAPVREFRRGEQVESSTIEGFTWKFEERLRRST